MTKLARPRAVIAALALLAVLAGSAMVGVALANPTVPAHPTQPPIAVVGARLFVAKGCITCHQHDALAGDPVPPSAYPFTGIPDLTSYGNDAAYLRRWLADPQAVRPDTAMPNLGLTPEEIEALIAFLEQPPDSKSEGNR